MGNKMGTMLSKKLKKINKSRLQVRKKLEDQDNESSYFTPRPKSLSGNSSDQDQDRLDDDDDSITAAEDDQESFRCEICFSRKGVYDSFNPKGCTHFYCVECTIRYISSKLDDSFTRITCPMVGCGAELDTESCRGILPKDVFDRWGVALCESVIDGLRKFYCPYNDCSALLINDVCEDVEKLSCPSCKREFCVKCKVPWHSEITCAKFRKLKKKGADAMLVDLAKRKKWKTCPKCKFYVEKSDGCFYMICRCKYAFCYNCGSGTTSHVCRKCKRRSWAILQILYGDFMRYWRGS